jgi:hypothetical protein
VVPGGLASIAFWRLALDDNVTVAARALPQRLVKVPSAARIMATSTIVSRRGQERGIVTRKPAVPLAD